MEKSNAASNGPSPQHEVYSGEVRREQWPNFQLTVALQSPKQYILWEKVGEFIRSGHSKLI